MQFIDTHCHLDFSAFDRDRVEVIERSQKAGVIRWVNPGVDVESSRRAIDLANQIPDLFVAVGIHPTEAAQDQREDLREIERLAKNPKVVAIGEIGLDYYHQTTSPEVQKEYLKAQLEIAATSGLPVIIHSRKAMAEVLDLLEKWCDDLRSQGSKLAPHPGVLHSFEGELEDALRATAMGFYLGVTGPITYLNAPERRTVFKDIPMEHLVLETDAPYLTPHPHRGQRNEPAYIPVTGETLAALHETTLDKVAEITTINANQLFAWRMPD